MNNTHPPTVYDSFTGITPCKVLRVYIHPNTNTLWIEARATARRPGFFKGEIFDAPARQFVPRRDVRTRNGRQFINTSHVWEVTPVIDTVYENEWCRIVVNGTYYVLQSKSGKYNDQYFATLTDAKRSIGVK